MWEELPRISWIHWWADRESHKYWNRLCFVLHSSRGKNEIPTSLVWMRKASCVWSGMAVPLPLGGQGIARLLLVFHSQECRKLWHLWDPSVCLKVLSLQYVFTLLLEQGCYWHHALAQDVPKDTVESIICNTTVIIYFSSLEYVFVGLGVEGFFLLLSCFSLWTKADLQWKNNDLLRVQFCLRCSHWQSSHWGLQEKQATIPILPCYPEIS